MRRGLSLTLVLSCLLLFLGSSVALVVPSEAGLVSRGQVSTRELDNEFVDLAARAKGSTRSNQRKQPAKQVQKQKQPKKANHPPPKQHAAVAHTGAKVKAAKPHPLSYGGKKPKNRPAPGKPTKDQRRTAHNAQKVTAAAKRKTNFNNRQAQRASRNVPPYAGHKATKAQNQAAKQSKNAAKHSRTQAKSKQNLADKKAKGRAFFGSTRDKYHATSNMPHRKATFTTPGGKNKFSGKDVRRAVFNSHHFSSHPTNGKPAEFRNAANGPGGKVVPIIKKMKGHGTEFPINHHRQGYQGREHVPPSVNGAPQKRVMENPGPARAIIQGGPDRNSMLHPVAPSQNMRYKFKGVVSHDERHGSSNAHHQLRANSKPTKNSLDRHDSHQVMNRLFKQKH